MALFAMFVALAGVGCSGQGTARKAVADATQDNTHVNNQTRHIPRSEHGTSKKRNTKKRNTKKRNTKKRSAKGRTAKARGGKKRTVAATRTARQSLASAVRPLIREDGEHAAVAVEDLTSGESGSFNGNSTFITASIVKVDILAALLYQSQQEGQWLDDDDQQVAVRMIEDSDNDAASDLYDDAGGAAGIDDANRVFGLRDTTVGTGGYWGLTTTSADDQVRLLREVFTRPSALSRRSQRYIQDLMRHVEPGQRWGVPAAAGAGTRSAVKNGWLPDPYLWEINSTGEIVRGGQRILIAVLSADNASEASGISVVQEIARRATAAITGHG